MNRLLILFVAILAGLSLFGCGTTSKKIQAGLQSEKTTIFSEVKDRSTKPKSAADLIIKANIDSPPYPQVFDIETTAVFQKKYS